MIKIIVKSHVENFRAFLEYFKSKKFLAGEIFVHLIYRHLRLLYFSVILLYIL